MKDAFCLSKKKRETIVGGKKKENILGVKSLYSDLAFLAQTIVGKIVGSMLMKKEKNKRDSP